jgi:hypothetical protein
MVLVHKSDPTFPCGLTIVSVRCPCSDGEGDDAIVSTIDSGHLGALYGGQEGAEKAGLV